MTVLFQTTMAILAGTLVLAITMSGLGQSFRMHVPPIAVTVTAIYELTFLGLQTGRGFRSYFNADTAFDCVGGMIIASNTDVLMLGATLVAAAILGAFTFKGAR